MIILDSFFSLFITLSIFSSFSNDKPYPLFISIAPVPDCIVLSNLDLDKLSYELRDKAANETSQQRKAEALKRLQVIEAFRDANTRILNKPEWMIVKVIPVIPSELRPLVPLDGGRFGTSDLTDLYR